MSAKVNRMTALLASLALAACAGLLELDDVTDGDTGSGGGPTQANASSSATTGGGATTTGGGTGGATAVGSGGGGIGGQGVAGGLGIPAPWITGLDNPFDLALDDTHVYWTQTGSSNPDDGAIHRVAKSEDADELVLSDAMDPRAVVSLGDEIFWLDGVDGQVCRANKTAGAKSCGSATGPSAWLAVLNGSGGRVLTFRGGSGLLYEHFTDITSTTTCNSCAGCGVRGIAVLGGVVYFTTPAAIRRVPPPSSTECNASESVVPTLTDAYGLAAAGTNLVVAHAGTLLLVEPLAAATTMLAAIPGVLHVAADATHAYALTDDDSGAKLFRVPLTGGTPQLLGINYAGAQRIAVDDDGVYWLVTGANAALWRLTKVP